MDAKQFLYIPKWVRVASFILLGFMVLAGCGVGWYVLVKGGRSELVQVALSIVQVAGSGLVIALVAFYSFRQAHASKLEKLTQDWLKKDLVGSLEAVGAPASNGNLSGSARLKVPSFIRAEVDVAVVQGNMAFYRVFARNTAITMCVRLKVREVLVIYFLPHGPLTGPLLETQLTQCFGVSKNTGYQLVFGEAHSLGFDDRSYHQFTLQQKLKDDFLVDTLEKLYLAQDIASMTHAFITECVDQSIHTHYRNDHGTLTSCLVG